MKNPWMIPVATLVVGAVGGYISGKGSAPAGEPAVEESALRTRASTRGEAPATSETARKSRNTSIGEISRIPGSSNRIQALLEFYGGLSADQLAVEAAKLENLPMNERIMASFLLFGRWAEVDPTAAMAFSNTMGIPGNFVRPGILQSWASVDPANAAKYFTENPREFAMMGMMGGRGPGGGQGGASIIASEWARQDPMAAMAWASRLPTGKGDAMNAVISEVAKTNPSQAAEMVGQLDAGDRGDAYRSIAGQYGASDFAAAQAWIRTLPAEEQADALASAIGGLSGTDPAAAAAQLAAMQAGEAKDRVLDDVIGNLARKDPQAAAALLKQQDNEEAQRDGMRSLMPAWTNQNPAAALAYAESFPQGAVRDAAIQSYIFSNTSGSPAELMKVATTIQDNGDRDRAVGMTAMRWMREDPEAAKAYVAASPDLSEEAKERISQGRGMWDGGFRRRGGGN